MDLDQRQMQIEQYKAGYAVIEAALGGITDDELDYRPAPGEWTVREIIHHLADSEMTSAIRIRRLIVEENAALPGYDQEQFAEQLWYADRPLNASLLAFNAARQTTGELLDRMTEEDWASAGVHSEVGTFTADDWLAVYSVHAHEHADQIQRNRQLAG